MNADGILALMRGACNSGDLVQIGHISIKRELVLHGAAFADNAWTITVSPEDTSWRIVIHYKIDFSHNRYDFKIEAFEQQGDPTDDLIWLKLRV